MASYMTFTTTRQTVPDPGLLRTAVQTATSDPTAIVYDAGGGIWRGKKATAWTPIDMAATQTALDTVAAVTPGALQQYQVDALPIVWKAIILALIDQLNTIRAALPSPLAPITPAQAITAIRNKAGTL